MRVLNAKIFLIICTTTYALRRVVFSQKEKAENNAYTVRREKSLLNNVKPSE